MSWAPGRGVRIVLPDSTNPDVAYSLEQYPGQSFGIEYFKFADGTTLSMADMLGRATAEIGAPNPAEYLFELGDGSQTLKDLRGLASVRLGTGIDAASALISARAGNDLFVRFNGADSLRIVDWYATQNVVLRFADGTIWDAAVLGSLPSIIVGTDGADSLYTPDGIANVVVGMLITLVGAVVLAVAWAAQRVGFLPYLIALEAVGMFVACRLLGAHIRRRPLRREA